MSAPLHVMSIDPGCTRLGHARIALLRTPLGGRFLYERGGHRELDRGWLTAELQQLRENGGVFALEVLIGGRFKGRMTASLNETAEMQGRILDTAAACGFTPPKDPLPVEMQRGQRALKIPAGDGVVKRWQGPVELVEQGGVWTMPTGPVRVRGWRGELCHTTRPSDKQIAAGVTRIVDGIPHLHHREREHVIDALGLAVVAAHRYLGVPVRLSREVEQALLLQRLADKAKPEKKQVRLYSRATRAAIGARLRAGRGRGEDGGCCDR